MINLFYIYYNILSVKKLALSRLLLALVVFIQLSLFWCLITRTANTHNNVEGTNLNLTDIVANWGSPFINEIEKEIQKNCLYAKLMSKFVEKVD